MRNFAQYYHKKAVCFIWFNAGSFILDLFFANDCGGKMNQIDKLRIIINFNTLFLLY